MRILHDDIKIWLKQLRNVILLSLAIVVALLFFLVYAVFPYIATARDDATKWLFALIVVFILDLSFYLAHYMGRREGIRYVKEKKKP